MHDDGVYGLLQVRFFASVPEDLPVHWIRTKSCIKFAFAAAVSFAEGSLEVKLPTIWTDGKAQPGSSSGMEKVRREKIRVGEDQKS